MRTVPGVPPLLLSPAPLAHSTPQQCPAQGLPQAALPAVPLVSAGCVVSVASTVHGGMLAPLSISASVALTCSISSSRLWVVGGCVGPPPLRLGSPQPPSPVRSRATSPPCTEKSWQRCWALYRSCRKSSRAERKSTHSRSSSRRSRGLAGPCRSPASSIRRSPAGQASEPGRPWRRAGGVQRFPVAAARYSRSLLTHAELPGLCAPPASLLAQPGAVAARPELQHQLPVPGRGLAEGSLGCGTRSHCPPPTARIPPARCHGTP